MAELQQQFYKTTTNGLDMPVILPAGSPVAGSGFVPISYDEWKTLAQRTGTVGNTNFGSTSIYDKALQGDPNYNGWASAITAANQGQTAGSGYYSGPVTQDNTAGLYSSDPAIPNPLASDPNQQNIGTATAPLYVPKGSAAATLTGGIQSGTVSPTSPTQQYQASMQGNNTTAPGVTPVAPPVPTATQSTTGSINYNDLVASQTANGGTGDNPNRAPATPTGMPTLGATGAPGLPNVGGVGGAGGSGGSGPAQPGSINISGLEQQYKGLLTPGADEQAAQNDYNNVLNSRDLGIEQIRNKQVPMQFIAGESDALTRQAALKLMPLQQRLATLQAQRQSSLDATKFALDRADQQAAQAKADAKEQQAQQQATTQALQKARTDLGVTQRFIVYPGSAQVYDTQTFDPATGTFKAVNFQEYKAAGGAGQPGAAFPDVQTIAPKANTTGLPASAQEYEYAKAHGYTGTYEQYQNEDANRKRVSNTTVINNQNTNSGLSAATTALSAPGVRGTDGYVDPNVYLTERTKYASANHGNTSGFDDTFASYLSPQERARLGIGKAAGVTATDSSSDY